MTIDPRVGFWISLLAAVFSAAVGLTTEFTSLVGPEASKMIVGSLIIGNTMLNAVNAFLHAIPSADMSANTSLKGAMRTQKRVYYLGPK